MRDTGTPYDGEHTSRGVAAGLDGAPATTRTTASGTARDDKGKDVSFDADSDDETLQIEYRNVDLEKGENDVSQRLLASGGPSTPESTSDSDNDASSRSSTPVGGRGKKNKKTSKEEEPKRQETVRWRDLPEKGQLTVLTLARLSEPLVQTSLQVCSSSDANA